MFWVISMLNLFVVEAFAAETAALSSGSLLSNLIPIALIMIVFYFLLLRPQQKKMRKHQNMIKALEKGSTVVFGGGIIGTIVKSDEEHILSAEIAPNVKIRIRRESVTELVKDEVAKKLIASEEKLVEKKARHGKS
ncbi:MAG: preprotein translocase subunit YajC [Candidatus Midichloria sp.]|uniref:Preprotein translocase subunit YajC n=1 Tax=Hyalomma marginatum TaxID=34627 RepID=A0A8S4C0G4_9ACAR|nr:preprotein translocase subunit YajC [Hyalomma marginatum]CAG7591896.1 preprotein translocase subunit YajC [Hyalomma marginatum]